MMIKMVKLILFPLISTCPATSLPTCPAAATILPTTTTSTAAVCPATAATCLPTTTSTILQNPSTCSAKSCQPTTVLPSSTSAVVCPTAATTAAVLDIECVIIAVKCSLNTIYYQPNKS